MTPKEAFDQLEAKRNAIPLDEIRPPTGRDVQDLIDEMDRVFQLSDRDRARFFRLANAQLFDMDNVDFLDKAALGLQYAESTWIFSSNPTGDPVIAKKLKLAEDVRSMIWLDLQFVAMKFKPQGLARALSELREGSMHRDMLWSLTSEAALADKYAEQMQKIGHNPTIAAEAARLCIELRNVLGTDKKEVSRTREDRDRAWSLAKSMYDEVCTAGQFLFRKDPQRFAEYVQGTSANSILLHKLI